MQNILKTENQKFTQHKKYRLYAKSFSFHFSAFPPFSGHSFGLTEIPLKEVWTVINFFDFKN